MVVGRKGGEPHSRGLEEDPDPSSSSCSAGDEFTVSGFEDGDKNDGCYTVLDYHFDGVFNGVARFSLDSRSNEENRGLVFTATDMDNGPDGPYWIIEDLVSGNVCVDFHFNKPTETHPTKVVAWECQGGGTSSIFAEATFSVSCGCSGEDNKSREGARNAATVSTKKAVVPGPMVAVGGIFAFAVFLVLARSLVRLNRRWKGETTR